MMPRPYAIYFRVACLIALSCSVTILVLCYAIIEHTVIEWIDGVIVGSMFMPTMFAAAWAAFGPARLAIRLPLSLAWAGAMGLSLDIPLLMSGGPRQFGYFTLISLVLWLLALLPFWSVALYFGLKLRHQGTSPRPDDQRLGQFGIRQLMLFTAFVALLLGIGRLLLESLSHTRFDFGELRFWGFLLISQIAISVPLICATMLPRHVVKGTLISLLLIVGVAVAQATLAAQIIGPSSGFGYDYVLFLSANLTSVCWALIFGVVVRYSGYHFGVPMVGMNPVMDTMPTTATFPSQPAATR